MTKLTDINGAREALPITHHDFKGEGWFCNNDLSNVHLEVDVEAMAKIIVDYCRVNALLYNGTLNLSRHLSDNIPKWARLVRK